jgi:hypothetical protein
MKSNISSKNFFKEALTQQGEKCFDFTVVIGNDLCNIRLIGSSKDCSAFVKLLQQNQNCNIHELMQKFQKRK